MNFIITVVNYNLDNWKKLIEWNKSSKVLNSLDLGLVEVALNINYGKIPTDKQCQKILSVLEKARSEGFLE